MIDYKDDYIDPSVRMIVEEDEKQTLEITYLDLDVEDTVHLILTLVEKVGKIVGQDVNSTLEDLKLIEEEGEI